MKSIAKCVQQFITTNLQDSRYADFVPFDRVVHTGFWRYIVVRQSERT